MAQNYIHPELHGNRSTDPDAMMKALMQAFTSFAQAQGDSRMAAQRESSMSPPIRHLGMGGEPVAKENGPYNSGGIDWLKANRDPNAYHAGGFQPVDPTAREATIGQMRNAGVYRPPGNVIAEPQTTTFGGPNPAWIPTAGGVEMMNGMNPQNPWSDSNWGSIQGGLSKKQGQPQGGSPAILDETGVRFTHPKTAQQKWPSAYFPLWPDSRYA